MLTRLEVDGFNQLVDVAADFGPFTCIAGAINGDTSNLFDAIRLLSLLATYPLVEAAQHVRDGEPRDLRDLFARGVRDAASALQIRIAAEMLVKETAVDDLGRSVRAQATFLRYDVEIAYVPPDRGALGGVRLVREQLTSIADDVIGARLAFPHDATGFRDRVIKQKRKAATPIISTRKNTHGQTVIVRHEGGGAQSTQAVLAEQTPRTVLSTANSMAMPTILAARREMQRWHVFAFVSSAMRRADRFQTEPHVTRAGGHLAATLYRLAQQARQRGDDADTVYAGVANWLARLVPIDAIGVQADALSQALTIVVRERGGARLLAAALSDGTLRMLALAILAADPDGPRVVCLEAPEQCMHPAQLREMHALLQTMAVDAQDAPSPENPLRQVIVITHSPPYVQLQQPNDMLVAEDVLVRNHDGMLQRTLRLRALNGTWRARHGRPTTPLHALIDYLAAPDGARITMPRITGDDPAVTTVAPAHVPDSATRVAESPHEAHGATPEQ